jgi:organic radical activating enzyme
MTKSCDLKGNQKIFLLHLNKVASCCKAWPIDMENQSVDYYLDLWKTEKEQLAQGVELPGCNYCWQAENNGQASYRQQTADKNFNQVEIFVSNLCNQMCSYCSPKYSSTWENNIQQFGNFTNVSRSAKNNLNTVEIHADQDQWIDNLKDLISREPVSVKLLGGEPLMQHRNLQQLLEFNTDQIVRLSINTNLNPPNNKFLKWVLDKFPLDKLTFNISLDTLPEHNAVPRAGFDKTKFLENLDLLKQYSIPFKFLSVISVLNIFSIADYQDWLTSQNHMVKFSPINHPDCLSASLLPDQFKDLIRRDKLPVEAQELLDHTPINIDLKRFEQYNYLKQYLQRTNTVVTDQRLENYLEWLKENYENHNRSDHVNY